MGIGLMAATDYPQFASGAPAVPSLSRRVRTAGLAQLLAGPAQSTAERLRAASTMPIGGGSPAPVPARVSVVGAGSDVQVTGSLGLSLPVVAGIAAILIAGGAYWYTQRKARR